MSVLLLQAEFDAGLVDLSEFDTDVHVVTGRILMDCGPICLINTCMWFYCLTLIQTCRVIAGTCFRKDAWGETSTKLIRNQSFLMLRDLTSCQVDRE